ncbi:MAG TPA: phosphatase PAP2 family protein [Candidatus Sulfotelmatobacter sp.]|jgi:membrane-associated phospholipid phosphatase|nr:phosphatase PAP2 family protein [Candidatus Sulfotelmatobacter sp.]
MFIHVPDTSKCCLFVFLLGAILQGIPAFCQELPDAPSVVRNASFSATERSDAASDPPKSPDTGSLDSSDGKFLSSWAKRGLRDQSGIYTAPFHRSELKWVIGMAAVTLGLIAIDKHASGALSRNGTNVSTDISNVGLFGTAGAVGILLLDGEARGNSHALETGVLGAEAMANSGVVYAALQLITERQRPLQGAGRGNFFETSGLDNSFPSGHTIITWTAASTIAREYPKPWVEWLAYGTAMAVSVTRFTSLQHFPSDVVVGSTLGYLIGRHIFHEHCKAGLSPICKKQ